MFKAKDPSNILGMLITFVLCMMIWAVPSAAEETQYVYPSDDAHIRAGTYSTNNYGLAGLLELKNSPSVENDRDVLLRFNLNDVSIPVAAAMLKLYNTSGYTCNIDVYTLDGTSWSEGSVTWSNAPKKAIKLGSVAVPRTGEVVINVTPYILSALETGKRAEFCITNDSGEDKPLSFQSKEWGVAAPTLELVDEYIPHYQIIPIKATVNNGSVTVEGGATSLRPSSVPPVNIVQCYNETDGALLGMRIIHGNGTYDEVFQIPEGIEHIRFKAMLWDGMDTIMPYDVYSETYCIVPHNGSTPFSHPGVFQSADDIVRMQTLSSTSGSPVKAGYSKMLESEFSSLSYQHQAYQDVSVLAAGSTVMEDHFRNDAHAAYALALRWIKTGDTAYRDKSIGIMNDWANTFKSISCQNYAFQPALEASWAVPLWVTAAETIRYYGDGSAAWGTTGIAQFEVFVGKMMNYVNSMGGGFNPNWIASRALAQMAAGVFLDEPNLYNTGYNEMESHIKQIGADGKPSENDRDCVHAQYNVIATSQGAEIAYHQGSSALYLKRLGNEGTNVPPLLLRQSEYFARQLMGDVPLGGHNYSAESKHNPPYEMLLARYKYDFSMQMMYTESFVLSQNRPVDCSEPHFVGWTTLTHAR